MDKLRFGKVKYKTEKDIGEDAVCDQMERIDEHEVFGAGDHGHGTVQRPHAGGRTKVHKAFELLCAGIGKAEVCNDVKNNAAYRHRQNEKDNISSHVNLLITSFAPKNGNK
jgi:hypothetical protein